MARGNFGRVPCPDREWALKSTTQRLHFGSVFLAARRIFGDRRRDSFQIMRVAGRPCIPGKDTLLERHGGNPCLGASQCHDERPRLQGPDEGSPDHRTSLGAALSSAEWPCLIGSFPKADRFARLRHWSVVAATTCLADSIRRRPFRRVEAGKYNSGGFTIIGSHLITTPFSNHVAPFAHGPPKNPLIVVASIRRKSRSPFSFFFSLFLPPVNIWSNCLSQEPKRLLLMRVLIPVRRGRGCHFFAKRIRGTSPFVEQSWTRIQGTMIS